MGLFVGPHVAICKWCQCAHRAPSLAPPCFSRTHPCWLQLWGSGLASSTTAASASGRGKQACTLPALLTQQRWGSLPVCRPWTTVSVRHCDLCPMATRFTPRSMFAIQLQHKHSCSQHALLLVQADDSVQDLVKDLDDLLALLPKGRAAPPPQLTESEAEEEQPTMVLQCDVNGCTIVPVAPTSASPRGSAGAPSAPAGLLRARARRHNLQQRRRP